MNLHNIVISYDKVVLSDIKMARQGRKKISHLETCFENHMFIQPSFLFSNGLCRVAYHTQATARQQQHQKQHHPKRTWKTTKSCNHTKLPCIACGASWWFLWWLRCWWSGYAHIIYQCCDSTQLVWEKPKESMTWQIRITKKYLLFLDNKKMPKQVNKPKSAYEIFLS